MALRKDLDGGIVIVNTEPSKLKTIRYALYGITILMLCISSVLAFAVAPPERFLGESARLIYIHVPLAFSAVLSFVLSGIFAARYLLAPKEMDEIHFHNAAILGIFFTVLTTVTGAAWAHIAWGVWWNWDPRETSILFLLAVYAAYFSLSASTGSRSARYRAAYLVFAAAVMPFFVFVSPRIYPSLHPDTLINSQRTVKLVGSMRLALFTSMIAYALMMLSLFDFANRVSLLERKKI